MSEGPLFFRDFQDVDRRRSETKEPMSKKKQRNTRVIKLVLFLAVP